MGEMADDAIYGFACSHCGVYFVAEHGYPVLCRECYEKETPEERKGLPLATLALLGSEESSNS
jgi:hypothetical protein